MVETALEYYVSGPAEAKMLACDFPAKFNKDSNRKEKSSITRSASNQTRKSKLRAHPSTGSKAFSRIFILFHRESSSAKSAMECSSSI